MNCVMLWEKPFHTIVCLRILRPSASYWNHLSCVFHCLHTQDFSWNVSPRSASYIPCSSAFTESQAVNVWSRLILKHCNYCILIKITPEIHHLQYLMYKFLFLDSDLKVHSVFCFEASFSPGTVLSISLVIVPAFPCASGEREVCREG